MRQELTELYNGICEARLVINKTKEELEKSIFQELLKQRVHEIQTSVECLSEPTDIQAGSFNTQIIELKQKIENDFTELNTLKNQYIEETDRDRYTEKLNTAIDTLEKMERSVIGIEVLIGLDSELTQNRCNNNRHETSEKTSEFIFIPCTSTRLPEVCQDQDKRFDLTVFAEHIGSDCYRLRWEGFGFKEISEEVLHGIEDNRFGFRIPRFSPHQAASFPFTDGTSISNVLLVVNKDNGRLIYRGTLQRVTC